MTLSVNRLALAKPQSLSQPTADTVHAAGPLRRFATSPHSVGSHPLHKGAFYSTTRQEEVFSSSCFLFLYRPLKAVDFLHFAHYGHGVPLSKFVIGGKLHVGAVVALDSNDVDAVDLAHI